MLPFLGYSSITLFYFWLKLVFLSSDFSDALSYRIPFLLDKMVFEPLSKLNLFALLILPVLFLSLSISSNPSKNFFWILKYFITSRTMLLLMKLKPTNRLS